MKKIKANVIKSKYWVIIFRMVKDDISKGGYLSRDLNAKRAQPWAPQTEQHSRQSFENIHFFLRIRFKNSEVISFR